MIQERWQVSSLAQCLRHAIGGQRKREWMGRWMLLQMVRPLVKGQERESQPIRKILKKTVSHPRTQWVVHEHRVGQGERSESLTHQSPPARPGTKKRQHGYSRPVTLKTGTDSGHISAHVLAWPEQQGNQPTLLFRTIRRFVSREHLQLNRGNTLSPHRLDELKQGVWYDTAGASMNHQTDRSLVVQNAVP